MKITLYVLKLENNKYYVGQTDQSIFRINQHHNGMGAKWTMRYRPVNEPPVLTKEVDIENARDAMLYENWLTLLYMEKFGWENVRGGNFLQLENDIIRTSISQVFDTETNKIRDFVTACIKEFDKAGKYFYGASNNWLVYVLELEDNKFYIGSTKRLGKNLANQFLGNGIEWTRSHKPVKIRELHVIPEEENYLNFKQHKTIEYMRQFGPDNVRGGNQ